MGTDQAADDALNSLRSSFPGPNLLEPVSVGAEELAQALGITKPGKIFTRSLER